MPKRQLLALLFAAITLAVRLPFLVTGKIPFDSDEAVEGLMARHVLDGELPAFFWGQAFKGVPEVYASAGAFALFGSKRPPRLSSPRSSLCMRGNRRSGIRSSSPTHSRSSRSIA